MAEVPPDVDRRFPLARFRRPQLAHGLGMIAAALLTGLVTWLAWTGYRQPAFLLDIANAMTLC
jgi:hypothetical protein